MEKKTIGTFIATLRKANGLTQRQLAEKLNVSDKSVSRWERDETAPDLSLIPVIAEIFGITSDELLRGERSTVYSDTVRATEKAEKQIHHILKETRTKYMIRSCISATAALLGLIGAMICNLVFFRAYLGFLVGCIFLVISTLCQIIFLILSHSAIDQNELSEAFITPVRRSMVFGTELVFGIIILLFAACLPLVILPGNAFRGLAAGSWLRYGAAFALITIPLVLLPCSVYNLKRGYWHKFNLKTPENRLRLYWLKRAAVLLLTMVILHAAAHSLLSHNYHLLIGGYEFDDWDSFRRYMETPTDSDGTPLTFRAIEGSGENTLYIYEDQNGGTVIFHKGDVSRKIYASIEDKESDSTPLVRYRHLNKQIGSIRLNHGGLPVQVFTQTQIQIVKCLTILLHALWIIGYLVAGRKIICKYREAKVRL